MKIFTYICIAILMGSCNTPEPEVVQEAIIEPAPVLVETVLIESTPEAFLNAIRARATGIEATMYTSGASFSVFDQGSAFAFTQQITLQAPKSLTNNQIGHIMLLENGENILLGGVYDNGTDVYMKIEDKENAKVYYSVIIDKARDMFTNVKVKAKEAE